MGAGHRTRPEFGAVRPQQPSQKAWQFRGMRLVDKEHVHWSGIIAPQERVLRGSREEVLLAKRGLPAFDVQRQVGIEQTELVEGRNRQGWLRAFEVRGLDRILNGLGKT